jgi:hypothetical protein
MYEWLCAKAAVILTLPWFDCKPAHSKIDIYRFHMIYVPALPVPSQIP